MRTAETLVPFLAECKLLKRIVYVDLFSFLFILIIVFRYEARWVIGVLSGMITKSKKIGYIGSIPFFQVNKTNYFSTIFSDIPSRISPM